MKLFLGGGPFFLLLLLLLHPSSKSFTFIKTSNRQQLYRIKVCYENNKPSLQDIIDQLDANSIVYNPDDTREDLEEKLKLINKNDNININDDKVQGRGRKRRRVDVSETRIENNGRRMRRRRGVEENEVELNRRALRKKGVRRGKQPASAVESIASSLEKARNLTVNTAMVVNQAVGANSARSSERSYSKDVVTTVLKSANEFKDKIRVKNRTSVRRKSRKLSGSLEGTTDSQENEESSNDVVDVVLEPMKKRNRYSKTNDYSTRAKDNITNVDHLQDNDYIVDVSATSIVDDKFLLPERAESVVFIPNLDGSDDAIIKSSAGKTCKSVSNDYKQKMEMKQRKRDNVQDLDKAPRKRKRRPNKRYVKPHASPLEISIKKNSKFWKDKLAEGYDYALGIHDSDNSYDRWKKEGEEEARNFHDFADLWGLKKLEADTGKKRKQTKTALKKGSSRVATDDNPPWRNRASLLTLFFGRTPSGDRIEAKDLLERGLGARICTNTLRSVAATSLAVASYLSSWASCRNAIPQSFVVFTLITSALTAPKKKRLLVLFLVLVALRTFAEAIHGYKYGDQDWEFGGSDDDDGVDDDDVKENEL